MKKYYSNLPIRSYNAVINFSNGGRNIGKSSSWKITALRAFVKDGRCTCWVRRTADQKDACKERVDVFIKKDILPQLGGITYDDLRIRGDYLELKDGKKWKPVINFCALSQPYTERSVDGLPFAFMVFDEYTCTPTEYALFRGDECRNLFDLYVTKARMNQMRLYCLGNREAYNNPYYNYLGISPPPVDFCGIKTYKNGTIAVEHDLTPADVGTDTYTAFTEALSGTPYGKFLTDNAADGGGIWHIERRPPNATHYAAVYVSGRGAYTIWERAGQYYITRGCDKSRVVFADTARAPFRNVFVLSNSQKRWFDALTYAAKINAVFFENEECCEAWHFIKNMCCAK